MNKTKKYKYLRKNRHSKRSKHSKHSKHGNKNKKTRKIQRGGQPLGSTLVHSGDRIGYTGTGTAAIQAQRLLSRNTPSNSLSEEEQKKENALRMKELKERYELEMEEYKRNKQADEEEAKRIAAAEKAAAAAVAKQEAAEAAAAAAAAAPVTNSPYSEDPDLKAAELEKAALQDSESKQKPSVNLPLVLDRVEAWGKETLIPGTTTAMDKDLEQEKRMVLIKVNPKANENIGNQIEHFTSENETLLAGLKSLDLDINGYESKLQLNEQLSEKEMDHLKELKEQKEQKELKMGSNTNQINELRVILGDNPTEDLGPSYNPMMVPGQEISSQHNTHRTAHMPPPIRQRIPAAAPAAAAETKAAAAAEKAQPSRPPVPTVLPKNETVARRMEAEQSGKLEEVNPERYNREPGLTGKIKKTFENAAAATRKIFSKKSPEEVAAAAQAEAKRKAEAQALKAAQIYTEQTATHKLKRVEGKTVKSRVGEGLTNMGKSVKQGFGNLKNRLTRKNNKEDTEPLIPKEEAATKASSTTAPSDSRNKTWRDKLPNFLTRKNKNKEAPDSSQPTSSANSSKTPPSPPPTEVATPYNPNIPVPKKALPPPPSALQESPRVRPPPPTNRPPVSTPDPSSIVPQTEPSPRARPPPPPRPTSFPPSVATENKIHKDTWTKTAESEWVPGAQSAGNITRKNRQYIHEIKDNRTHIFNKEMEIINSIRNFKHGHNHGHGPNEHGKNKPENIQKKFIKVIKRS